MLNIALVGDLKYARTMHSLIKGLSLYKLTLFLISPKELQVPEELRNMLQHTGAVSGRNLEFARSAPGA